MRKGSNYEIIKLENEIIVFEFSLEWSRDDHTTRMIM